MRKNQITKLITISIVCLILLCGKSFSQPFANWHLNTSDSSCYFNSGFVGIGVQHPISKLDINGDLHLNGDINVDGMLNFSGYASTNSPGGFIFRSTNPSNYNFVMMLTIMVG